MAYGLAYVSSDKTLLSFALELTPSFEKVRFRLLLILSAEAPVISDISEFEKPSAASIAY